MTSEVLSSPEVIKKPDSKNKVGNFFSNSILIKIIFILISLLISFFAQQVYYKPNFGTMIDSDMDASGNTYVLSVSEKSSQYKVTKISPDGKVSFEMKLPKPNANEFFKYKYLEVDSKGNFFITKEVRNLDTIVSNPTKYPISKESIRMYDDQGKSVKEVASFDYASASMYPTVERVKKVQIVNQKLTIVCFNENVVEIIGVNPYLDQPPTKELTFSVNPPLQSDYDWINDYAVTLSGSVVYSTKSGDLYLVRSDAPVTNCNSLLPVSENSISSMCTDRLNNVYFMELETGTFYKFNTDTMSMSIEDIYLSDSSIKIDDLTIKDLRKIRAINEDDFFGASKTFVNPFFVRFGNTPKLISNISYKFFPYGLIFTLVGALLLLALILFAYKFFKIGLTRTYVSVKATFMFLPVFIAFMMSIVFYSTNKSMSNYIKVLRQNQTVGSKLIAEKLDGDSLVHCLYNSNYMSPEFQSMKNAVNSAYIDLKNKVGDNSDYIVVYAINNNKIYSVINNKYSGDSKYYEMLKFADPDMTQNKISIVDSSLERDEIENIYSIWSRLQDKQDDSIISTFRDIHGNLDAAFVPIKNSAGAVVGMVGNFIDEQSHIKTKMFEVLRNSSFLIGITSVLVFLYLCLILWIILKPMRIMKRGIEFMVNGHWNHKIPIVSKDEFASISMAFNNMSDKLEEYTNNLMDLNSEYLRYVPKELLNFVGKNKITQTSVGNGQCSTVSIVYITFNIRSLSEEISDVEHEMFLSLQNCYSKMFDVVASNSGVVQNFSSLGATLIFNDKKSAMNSALQIFELDLSPIIKKNMRITVGSGKSFIGILGTDIRRGVSMASEEMLRLIKIDSGIQKLGIRFASTGSGISDISKNISILTRFVGKIKDISEISWVNIYEIINTSNTFEKDLILQTKSMFERAIQLYMDDNIKDARELFVDVLHKNKNDKVTLYYINMCDLKLNSKLDINKLEGAFGEIFKN